MAFTTIAAMEKHAGTWRTALAFSVCVHVGVILSAGIAARPRPCTPVAAPIEFLVQSAAPLPPPVPVAESAATASEVGRFYRRVTRLRSEHLAHRSAPPVETPAADSGSAGPQATTVAAAADTVGNLAVSAPIGDGEARAGHLAVVAPVGQASDADAPPRILQAAEGNGQLAIDPSESRYQPVIPPPLRKPGARFVFLLKLCVEKDGSVGKVTIVRSSDPAVDPAIVEKLKLFKFRPYLDHGRPIPFCFFREYELSVE